jgi:hypothetical protein
MTADDRTIDVLQDFAQILFLISKIKLFFNEPHFLNEWFVDQV